VRAPRAGAAGVLALLSCGVARPAPGSAARVWATGPLPPGWDGARGLAVGLTAPASRGRHARPGAGLLG
jgi:hypothetical protein